MVCDAANSIVDYRDDGGNMAGRAETVLSREEREVLARWARRPKTALALALRCAAGSCRRRRRGRQQGHRCASGLQQVDGREVSGRFARRGLDGLLPLMPGVPERDTHDYVRDGRTNLYAALGVASGKVSPTCHRPTGPRSFGAS